MERDITPQETFDAKNGQNGPANLDETIPQKRINKDFEKACEEAARTVEEKLACLTSEQLRQPDNTGVKEEIYHEVRQLLERDPFLAYHDETEELYQVRERDENIFVVPKLRAVPEPYPVELPRPIRAAHRYLLLALFGLMLSGIGAILFAPLAALQAGRAVEQAADRPNRARVRVVFILSLLVFAAGLALAYLFWLHVRG